MTLCAYNLIAFIVARNACSSEWKLYECYAIPRTARGVYVKKCLSTRAY